ncbi:MAG: AEC family transporter [Candidatus Eisenbacteria bacterium]|uniref:AEC family transporter n=1 Tax=Eiseniibacteriota bacterium TaxID=2212470 RepID=A0A538U227_UNCEI|nr:MAG: AEC family transporter [Candidatus Eisenbacteria bacterium]
MSLLRLFVEHLLPVLLVAGAGYLLASLLDLDGRAFTAVAFHLFAPCLIFQTLLESRVPAGMMLLIGAFAALTMAIPAGEAWAIARLLRWSRTRSSAVVMCVLFPNVGNYGLSANLLAFGKDALTYASVFFVAASIVFYTVGVLIASLGRAGVRPALLGLLRVPALWALIAAFLLRALHVPWSGAPERAVSLLAAACIPSFLVVLGMQLRGARLRGAAMPMALATGLRLLGGMAAGLLCAPLMGLTGTARQAAVLEAAMPTAVVTGIIAGEYEVEPSLVASVVLLTTLLSPLTLTPLLWVLR